MSIAVLWSNPYFRWHTFFVIIPSVFLWGFGWRALLKYKKTILLFTILAFCGGFLMDMIASVWLHIWYFNEANSLGISFLGLPIEEYFFLIFVPQELVGIFVLVRKIMKYGKI